MSSKIAVINKAIFMDISNKHRLRQFMTTKPAMQKTLLTVIGYTQEAEKNGLNNETTGKNMFHKRKS